LHLQITALMASMIAPGIVPLHEVTAVADEYLRGVRRQRQESLLQLLPALQ
jgi:hypothetical protein